MKTEAISKNVVSIVHWLKMSFYIKPRKCKNFIATKTHKSWKRVPDQYKTQKMCEKSTLEESLMLIYCPNQYKTQEMCERVVLKKSWSLEFVCDQHKMQECTKRLQIKIHCVKSIQIWRFFCYVFSCIRT